MEGEALSSNNFYKQHLKVSDNMPVYIKNYRLPHVQYNDIHEQVQELFENDNMPGCPDEVTLSL